MKANATIKLMIVSNVFLTRAWQGQLKLKDLKWFENNELTTIVIIKLGINCIRI